jgi:hypothetical protein
MILKKLGIVLFLCMCIIGFSLSSVNAINTITENFKVNETRVITGYFNSAMAYTADDLVTGLERSGLFKGIIYTKQVNSWIGSLKSPAIITVTPAKSGVYEGIITHFMVAD